MPVQAHYGIDRYLECIVFTLEQARQFIAVAEELHFGRAAERLAMTQPPLSRQVQKLERSVGVTLLERDSRKVTLTAAGQAFLAEARRVVTAAERAPLAARRIASGRAGEIRIGFTAATGFSLLGPLLSTITAALPEIDIALEEMVTGEQVRALQRGDLDLGLARPPFDAGPFESWLLLSEHLVLAVPAGHPLTATGRPLRSADLSGEPLIMHHPTRARYFYDLVIRQLAVAHENVVHVVSQILTMVSLVAAGRGVAFVPESARLLGIEGVEYLDLAEFAPDAVELHAIWTREVHNPALRQVLEALRAEAG